MTSTEQTYAQAREAVRWCIGNPTVSDGGNVFWEDKNENLKISSYVFTEIEARKWMYDMRGVARGETIQPLQVIRADGDEINVDKRGHRNNRPTFDGSLPAPAQ